MIKPRNNKSPITIVEAQTRRIDLYESSLPSDQSYLNRVFMCRVIRHVSVEDPPPHWRLYDMDIDPTNSVVISSLIVSEGDRIMLTLKLYENNLGPIRQV